MKKVAFGCLMLCMAAACFGQDQAALCPRHIEAPGYPAIARTAHVTGKVTLAVTIDADGKVVHVDATVDDPRQQAHPLLQKFAVENMQHWTFAKPPSAPYTQIIVYDYEFDQALPTSGGKSSLPAITKTTFDLPDHVTIATNLMFIDTQNARPHN
jgi:TonB family protein